MWLPGAGVGGEDLTSKGAKRREFTTEARRAQRIGLIFGVRFANSSNFAYSAPRRVSKAHSAKRKTDDVISHKFSPVSYALLLAPCPLQFFTITLSALASTFGGIVRPICFAVLRLITSSNFVGCSTGRSAALAPFRILST